MGSFSFPGENSRFKIPRIALILLGGIIILHILYLYRDTPMQMTRVSMTDAETTPVTPTPGAPPPASAEHKSTKKPTEKEKEKPTTKPADTQVDKPKFAAQFPRRMWQTFKAGAGGLDEGDREAVNTWTQRNPRWRHELITRESAESYVRNTFRKQPEYAETFIDIQDSIFRADLIRYLVLLGDGGIYSDIDTKCLKPIDEWIPKKYNGIVNVVVGVEYDTRNGEDPRWGDWTLDLQFATWAILAKPGHPVLETTVRNVVQAVKALALKKGQTVSTVVPHFKEVLDTTGPAIFTRSVFESISKSIGSDFTWKNVTKLTEPRLVDDVLILPINAFGSGQLHSHSGKPEDKDALVHHLFKGSWKASHPFKTDEERKQEEEEEKQRKEKEEKEKKLKEAEESGKKSEEDVSRDGKST